MLLLDQGAPRIPFETLGVTEAGLALRLRVGTALRRELIRRLYTGACRNEVAEARLIPTLRGSLRRVLGQGAQEKEAPGGWRHGPHIL